MNLKKNLIFRKTISVIIAVMMIMVAISQVALAEETDSFSETENDIATENDEQGSPEICLFETETDQVDIAEAETDCDGAAEEESLPVNRESLETPEITITNVFDVNENIQKGTFNATLSGVSYEGAVYGVSFATWSATGGQDDLIWYAGTSDGKGAYSAELNPDNHKHTGTYYCHCYVNGSSGLKFISAREFTVETPVISNISVSAYNSDSQTATITIDFGSTLSGVRNVVVPIWSRSNQSDIVWYPAYLNSEGKYVVDFNLGNHKNLSGTYNVHVYYYDINNAFKFGKSEKFYVETNNGNLSIDASGSSGKYTVTLSGVAVSYPVDSISFPVWSKTNGQDDIIWYQASRTSNGTFTATVDINKHRTLGDYYVHAYASSGGSLNFLTSAVFNVAAPSGGTLNVDDISSYAQTGTYKVRLSGLENYGCVSSVSFPTWCKTDQSDIRWLTAVNEGNGNYYANVKLEDYNYISGTYITHAYVTDIFGNVTYIGSTNISIDINFGDVSVAESTDGENTFVVNINNVNVLSGCQSIVCPVWSKSGGQDDIIWYDAAKVSDGNYSATVKISNHKTVGTYYAHVYAKTSSGKMIFIGSDTFEVSGVTGTVSVDSDTHNISISELDSPSGIQKVQYAVWSKSDQSDIFWYSTNDSSSNYTVRFLYRNHNYNTGKYSIHAYVTTGNGIFTFAGSSAADFSEQNYVEVYSDNSEGSIYTISIVNVNAGGTAVSSVSFPTWCSVNGQDDMVWYPGTATANNSWTATMVTYWHKQEGTYYTHVYANGSVFLGSTEYTAVLGEFANAPDFTNPCPGGTLTSDFGYRAWDNSNHKGIDLAIAQGSPIYAAYYGRILEVGYNSLCGNYIYMDNGNGIVTKYLHCYAIYVTAGQYVMRGQVIAAVGTTGYSTGPHLHYQVEINGTAVSPWNYV